MSVFASSRKMSHREQTAYDLGFHEGQNAPVACGCWEPHPHHPGCVRCSRCKELIINEEAAAEEGQWNFCHICGADLKGKTRGTVEYE